MPGHPKDARHLGSEMVNAVAEALAHSKSFAATLQQGRPASIEGTVTAVTRDNTGTNKVTLRRTGQPRPDPTSYVVWSPMHVPIVGDVLRLLILGKGVAVVLGAKHGGRPNEHTVAFPGGCHHHFDSGRNHIHKSCDDHHHRHYATDGATIVHHNHATGHHAHAGDHFHNAATIGDTGTTTNAHRHTHQSGQYEHHFGTQRLRAHHPTNGHVVYKTDGTTVLHHQGINTGGVRHVGDLHHNVSALDGSGTLTAPYQRHTYNGTAGQYEHYHSTQLLRSHHPTNGHIIYQTNGTGPAHYHAPSGQHVHVGDHFHNASSISTVGVVNSPYVRHTFGQAIADPTAAPSLSLVAGSLTPGTYTVAYCWTVQTDIPGQETTAHSPTASITVGAGQAISVAALTLPVGATSVSYYFTAVPGGGTVGVVATGTGGTMTLNAQGDGATAPTNNTTHKRYERRHNQGGFGGEVVGHYHDLYSATQHLLDDGTGTGTRKAHQHDRQGHTHPFSGHRYDSDEPWQTVANPTFTPVCSALGGGSLIPGTYGVAYAWTNANGTTTISLGQAVTVAAGQAIGVASLLPRMPAGATGVSYWFTQVPVGGTTGLVATGTGAAITLNAQGNGASPPASNTTAAPVGRLRAKHGPTGHTALDHDGTNHRAWAFSGSTGGQHVHSYSAHTHPKGHIVGDDGAGTSVGKLYHQHASGNRTQDHDGTTAQHYVAGQLAHKHTVGVLGAGVHSHHFYHSDLTSGDTELVMIAPNGGSASHNAGGQINIKQSFGSQPSTGAGHFVGDDGSGGLTMAHGGGNRVMTHDGTTHTHFAGGASCKTHTKTSHNWNTTSGGGTTTNTMKHIQIGTAGGQLHTRQHNTGLYHIHGDDGAGLVHIQHATGNKSWDHDGSTHQHYSAGTAVHKIVRVGTLGGQTQHKQHGTSNLHLSGDDGAGNHHVQSVSGSHLTRINAGADTHTHAKETTTRPSGVIHSHPSADGSIHHNLTAGGAGALKRATHSTTPQVVGSGSATIGSGNVHIAAYTFPGGAPGDPHLKLLMGAVWDSGAISNPGFYGHAPAAILSNTGSAYSANVYNTLAGGVNTSYAWGTSHLAHDSQVDLYATKIGAPANLAVGTALWAHIVN